LATRPSVPKSARSRRGGAGGGAGVVRRDVRARRRPTECASRRAHLAERRNALRARNPNLDAATLSGLKQEFERIRLAKLRAVIKDLPEIYARHLTPPEMREIAAFYRTPTGTRLMQVVPAVIGEVFAIVLPAMPSVVNDTHEEFLRLARERGHIR
jgi:hypothetical protein